MLIHAYDMLIDMVDQCMAIDDQLCIKYKAYR